MPGDHEDVTQESKLSTKTQGQPSRFAHPFYGQPRGPLSHGEDGSALLLAHTKGALQAIPPPNRKPVFKLSEIIGAQGATDIEASGSIRFHSVGDTGRGADSPQGSVAEAMSSDIDTSHPETTPAFLFHLGDVIYGPNKDQNFRPEFYEPYVHYQSKIIAIPGNHDGEVFSGTDPITLRAFQANFCAPAQTLTPVAGTIYRQTMNQPGVYYLLDSPFVWIVALYSNAAENPGFISGQIPGNAQSQWLLETLKQIAAARDAGDGRALIIATHHPPYSSGGHSPSSAMLEEIDKICSQAGVVADMFLSGHSHNYQRYTRTQTVGGSPFESAYVVAGMGGIGAQPVKPADNKEGDNPRYVASRKGYGYLLIEVSKSAITTTVYAVDPDSGEKSQYERFVVDLKNHTVATLNGERDFEIETKAVDRA